MKTQPLSNSTVKRAFGSAIVAVLLVSAISYRGVVVSNESGHWVRHPQEVLENLRGVLAEMQRAESSYRGFVISGDENSLQVFHDAIARVEQTEINIGNLTVDNATQRRNMPHLVRLGDQEIQFAESMIALRREKGMEAAAEAVRGGEGARIMGEFQGVVSPMEAEESRLLVLREAEAQRRLLQTKAILIIGTVLGLLIAAAAGWSVQRDAMRRALAEEARGDSGAKYRGLLEAAPDAMGVVNPEGEIVLLNVQAEKQFGYHRDELVGQKVKNIIPEGFEERLISDSLRSNADAKAQQIGTGIELSGRCKDGSEFPIEIMLSPLDGVDGILVTAAIRNITERKRREDDLSRLAAVVESSHDAIISLTTAGNVLTWNHG